MRRKTRSDKKSKDTATRAPGAEPPRTAAEPPAEPAAVPAPVATAATVVDQKLVDEAVRWIQHKVITTLHRGLLEIGEYLFDRFYDRDPALVKSTDPRKHVSFRALTERCESVELPLSKTTLYNAISIAVMEQRLGHDAVFFKQLPSTHQATLLPLKDPAKVERLAQRALSRELTVRELREIVGAEISLRDTEGPPRGRPPLPTVLKSLRAIARQLTEESGRKGWTKAQVDELDPAQAREARKLAESIHGAVGKLVERLGQG